LGPSATVAAGDLVQRIFDAARGEDFAGLDPVAALPPAGGQGRGNRLLAWFDLPLGLPLVRAFAR